MSVKMNSTLSAVMVLCCFALLFAGCGREDAAYAAENRRMQKVREFCDKYYPLDIPSEAERASLAEIYGTAVRAYSNGQVAVIRQCETLISNRVVNLDHFVYASLSEGAVQLLYGNFLLSKNLKKIEDFPTHEALSDYLDVNLALVRFLGMAAAERLERENYVNGWEGLALRNIKEYKKRANFLGMHEHERIVDGFLAKWISLIESEKGLTRMKIRRYMPAMHVRARMVGDVSPAQVVKAVRWHALSLINCGYTPKWLDEEFPLLPEDGNGNGQVEHGCVGGGGVR